MIALFKNRLAYLSVSLILLIVAFPLISRGLTAGPPSLWWLGLIALACGGLIPPLQRLLLGQAPKSDNTDADDDPSDTDQPPTSKGAQQ
ncbi:MAG: hypothetical protein M0Q54_10540 [Pigmentiphaga sp.]|nr:hypothetical protein [Pigmentiphaga sp.]